MSKQVEIRLLGNFLVTVLDESGQEQDISWQVSRKKVSLLTYLILHEGKPVAAHRLIRELWPTKEMLNPANTLKTTINRLRNFLNDVTPGLGACIQWNKGAYFWQDDPRVHVDVLEAISLIRCLKSQLDTEERAKASCRLLDLYQGDLFLNGDMANGEQYASWLHREYLEAVYSYVEQLKAQEASNEIVRVCKMALQRDELDEYLRIELMRALVSLNRTGDAVAEYRQATRLSRRILDADPGEDLQACYHELSEAGHTIQLNLDAIRNELLKREGERFGPFFCDYEAFQEIYNIQMRNLERLGSTMFLGVMMVRKSDETDEEISDVHRESAMAGLQEIMRKHLRKGDIVTRFSPAMYAMLLPTVNYTTGSMVMERMEQLFYEEYPSRKVALHYRISPLGTTGIDTKKPI